MIRRRRAPHWLAALLGAAATLATSRGEAMTASDAAVETRQPDGSRILVRLRGDEWQHWHEDEKGFAIAQENGEWRYAVLDADGRLTASAHAVGRSDPEALGLERGIRPVLPAAERDQRRGLYRLDRAGEGIQAAPTGTVKNLVVLCLFSDHTVAANGRAVGAYDSLFNQVGSTGPNAPTGSVVDYWAQASYGTLTIASTVLAWVTLPNSENYYGNGANGLPFGANQTAYPRNAAQMVRDALALVDPLVNFRDFDVDNDGWVDAITIVHSGYGGEQNGNGADAIWSHQYVLGATNTGTGPWKSADKNAVNDTVKVGLYHTEPARFGGAGSSALLRVGVVAHELGHFFGLPDLYDTDQSSQGTGDWCLMGDSWGWDESQRYPPLPSAWCRIKLGWVSPLIVSAPGIVNLQQAATVPQVLLIPFGYGSNEYLLVENRQPVGFDQQIPQGGLAIWHIDESMGGNAAEGFPAQPGWPENGQHYMVALLQADGSYDLERNANDGDAGDLFRALPGTALSETTSPSTDRYQGGITDPTGNIISNVSAPGATMSFDLKRSLWVDFAYGGFEAGTFQQPYRTLVGAVVASDVGGRIICKPGSTTDTFTIGKAVLITSYGGTTIIGQ